MTECFVIEITRKEKYCWRCEREFELGEKVTKVIHMGMKQFYVFYFCEVCFTKKFIEKLVRRLR